MPACMQTILPMSCVIYEFRAFSRIICAVLFLFCFIVLRSPIAHCHNIIMLTKHAWSVKYQWVDFISNAQPKLNRLKTLKSYNTKHRVEHAFYSGILTVIRRPISRLANAFVWFHKIKPWINMNRHITFDMLQPFSSYATATANNVRVILW